MPKYTHDAISEVVEVANNQVTAASSGIPDIPSDKIKQMRRLSKASPPMGPFLTVMVVAKGKDVFSSGEVLRETSVALGEAMSPSTLHRVLPALVKYEFLSKVGPIQDPITSRAVSGYSLTQSGAEYLRCADRLAELAA